MKTPDHNDREDNGMDAVEQAYRRFATAETLPYDNEDIPPLEDDTSQAWDVLRGQVSGSGGDEQKPTGDKAGDNDQTRMLKEILAAVCTRSNTHLRRQVNRPFQSLVRLLPLL